MSPTPSDTPPQADVAVHEALASVADALLNKWTPFAQSAPQLTSGRALTPLVVVCSYVCTSTYILLCTTQILCFSFSLSHLLVYFHMYMLSSTHLFPNRLHTRAQLIENPLMMDASYHESILPNLLRLVRALPATSTTKLSKWWSLYSPSELLPITKAIHQYITIHVLISASSMERYLLNADTYGDDRALSCIVGVCLCSIASSLRKLREKEQGGEERVCMWTCEIVFACANACVYTYA